MTDLIRVLDSFGIHVDLSTPQSPLFLFAVSILVFSVIGLVCFIQILIYLVVIYVSDHPILLDKISKYPILVRIFKLYKTTRIAYLLLESGFLLFSLGSIIKLCLKVIYLFNK